MLTSSNELAFSFRSRFDKIPTMLRIPPATLASTKPDAALGAALGSEEPAQTKTNNQHTKLDQAMPVRTPQ